MDSVRVAVSIDSGILSLQPSLPRKRVTVVRPGWGAGTSVQPFCSGERCRNPRWSEPLRPEKVENMCERLYSEVAEIQLSKVRIPKARKKQDGGFQDGRFSVLA